MYPPVALLFAIVYFLTEATLSAGQIASGIVVAILAYIALIIWHLPDVLE